MSVTVRSAAADRYKGLSSQSALAALRLAGPNVIPRDPWHERLIKEFAANFTHRMAILLWAAGAIAFIGRMEQIGWAIWAVNIINGCFSFFQEYKADRAAQALQGVLPKVATVIRDGTPQRLSVSDVVPGDVIMLAAGDRIPADAEIFEDSSLVVDESILSGESLPVRKSSRQSQQRRNVVYSGTTIMSGSSKAIVLATGSNTSFGKMAALTTSAERSRSPLELEMARISDRISVLSVAIGVFVFLAAIGLAHVSPFNAFIFSLGMIVAFVPEGMVPTVALSLAVGVEEMAKQNALVKKLSAVETLGCTTVICTDKTGTLTQNKMNVRDVWLLEDTDENRQAFVKIECLCNDAELVTNGRPDGAAIIGDSTEAALLVHAAGLGTAYGALRNSYPRVNDLPFDPDRKRMTTIHREENSHFVACTKGAPTEVLRRCEGLTVEQRKQVENKANEFAGQGLRVLAFAQRHLSSNPIDATIGDIEQKLHFVGLAALFDPPRPEIRDAVRACHTAGIRVVMLTGDHARTAETVARHAEIVKGQNAQIVQGDEIAEMNDRDLRTVLEKEEVIFSRVSPKQKLRIVKGFQEMGEVVAATGDGVNDAAALRQANIGIAMGVRGTDVARESADIILLDDNFATIIGAVKLGRRVYDNIRKFAKYVFTSNMAEAVPVAAFVFSGAAIPLPITIMQVLSVDLGTDLVPALGLGVEAADDDVLKRKPRSLSEPLLSRAVIGEALLWYGLIEAIAAMACFFFSMNVHHGHGYQVATTMTLTGIVFAQIGTVLCCRWNGSILRKDVFSNRIICAGIVIELMLLACFMYFPLLQRTFGTAPITAIEWGFACMWFFLVIGLDEIRKRCFKYGRSDVIS